MGCIRCTKEKPLGDKSSRRREIIKISAKINEIETKKAIQRINETKSGSLKKQTRLTNPWQI
jgi:hypothetical protein